MPGSGVFDRWCLTLGGSVASSKGKLKLFYVHMCTHMGRGGREGLYMYDRYF